jgi:hypothetical protein
MPFKTIEFISEEGAKMKKVKRLLTFALTSFVVGIFLASSLLAQENPPAEPTKVEVPAARRHSLLTDCWNKSAALKSP